MDPKGTSKGTSINAEQVYISDADERTALLSHSEEYDDISSCESDCSSDSIGVTEKSSLDHEASVILASKSYHSCKAAISKALEDSTKSHVSRKSFLETLLEKPGIDKNATLFMTISNMLPMLQGSAVFGMPYAFMKAGILIIPGFILVCLLADITGVLLIECLYEISPRSGRRKRVRMDYNEVARACWGRGGKRLVNILNLIYMIVNNVVNVVLLGSSIHQLISNHINMDMPTTMAVFSLVFIPPLFIRKLSVLAYLSMVGVFSIIIGSITALVVLIKHSSGWSQTLHILPLFDLDYYPLGFAIMMYSLITHPLLPQIEGCMINPKHMNAAIHISYSVSTVIKIMFGFFGALTFGLATKQLVALNIAELSFAANVIIMGTLCLYAIANFALMMFVVGEVVDKVCVDKRCPSLAKDGKYNLIWMAISRTLLVGACVGIAYKLPYFALVSGMFGALIGVCVVYAFPIIFHLQLKWHKLSKLRRLIQIILLVVGVVAGLMGIYSSTKALIEAIVATKP